jgi:hypothetical protein
MLDLEHCSPVHRRVNFSMGKDRPPGRSRYFFVIRSDHAEDDDSEGTAFPSPIAAVSYAHRVIRELKERGGYDDPSFVMIVKDHKGKIVATIPF